MCRSRLQTSSVNRDIGGPTDLNSHRSSSSHISHTSTPANVWPPPTAIGKRSHNVALYLSRAYHIFSYVQEDPTSKV